MPKKGKKGKKGKGKKGKKSGAASEKKLQKDASIKSMSEANSLMWETRVELAEVSRMEYRNTARKLMLENDSLQTQIEQTEKDTIDVITYLKRQDQEKDKQTERMQQQVKEQKKQHRNESEQIIQDFQQQLGDVELRLAQKTHEVEVLQSELKQVKEFRRKRAQMQRELEEIKEAMFDANKEHKDTLTRMEQKFFEEKMRLQQEANQKIAELADRAHTEAIANLDETTKSVYKENVRVNEALLYHMSAEDRLKAQQTKLESENQDLASEKEMNDMVIQQKVSQTRSQKAQIKQLQEKVDTLEKSLSLAVTEFNTERVVLTEKGQSENESANVEIHKLQRTLELKTKEMNKVKRLAKNILDQRTEIERFFLESLEQVKKEIIGNRVQYRRDAQAAYRDRMLAAHTGKTDFPRIRTFNKTDNSTNSVFKDLEAAENLFEVSGRVDVGELTWEQKEKVLRYLFARMNGAKERRGTAPPSLHGSTQSMPALMEREAWRETDGKGEGHDDQTFLTQAAVDDMHHLPQLTQSHHQICDPVN